MVKPGFVNLSREEQEKILEAAVDEFSQKDYDSASINQIIQNAGISKGSMYHYFHSKEDLYMYMLNRVMEEKAIFLKEAMQNLERPLHELDFFESLAFQMEASVQFAKKNYRYHMINNHLQNMPDNELKEKIWGKFRDAFDQYIASMVDQAIEAGEVRKDLGREFIIRVLGFIIIKFADIYPDYRELLQKGDDVMLKEMKKLVDFLKFGLSEDPQQRRKNDELF